MSAEDIKPGDENVSALARIERIKRIVNGFCSSAFMRDLEHCTPVRPPIMRTNVIQKDPNFRACLTLWQFISSYDEVGYEITAKESNEMVPDDYKNDLFKLASVNYMLLKKNIGEQEFEDAKLKKRKVKPKLLKRLAEELVLNYDMEEVEIRKVFVDELKRANKKKTAGETKINEAIDRALKLKTIERLKLKLKSRLKFSARRKLRSAVRSAKRLALPKKLHLKGTKSKRKGKAQSKEGKGAGSRKGAQGKRKRAYQKSKAA